MDNERLLDMLAWVCAAIAIDEHAHRLHVRYAGRIDMEMCQIMARGDFEREMMRS
jgi:hypothetical protein